MTALVFGEIDRGRICERLLLGSVAGFSDLLTETLQKEAEGELGKL